MQGCLSLPALNSEAQGKSSGKACKAFLDQDKHNQQLSHTATQNTTSATWQLFASLLPDFADEKLHFTSWLVLLKPSFQRTVETSLERDYRLY